MPLSEAFPTDPPLEWFTTLPEWFEKNLKFTVITDGPEAGRVAATVANRDTCILDGTGECWTAPPSPTGYEDAQPGDTYTAEGIVIKTANLALDIPHAPIHLSYHAAVRVMNVTDDTSKLAARVRFVDTEWGTVALGAAWPEASDLQIRKMQATTLSGDWRPRPEYGNRLDMAGAIFVLNPGLPLPRRPVFQPVAIAASIGSPPVVFGNWRSEEEPMPLAQTITTVTCGGCGGLVTAPVRNASTPGAVLVSAPTAPCSCAHVAAAPDMAPPADDVAPVGREEFDALSAAVAELQAMVMDAAVGDLDAQMAALPASVDLPMPVLPS